MPAAIGGFPLIFPPVAISMGTCSESTTSIPFDGDRVPLWGSRPPFLGATSPPPASFYCLDTSVFSTDYDCNESRSEEHTSELQSL